MTRTEITRIALLSCTSHAALVRGLGAAFTANGTRRKSRVDGDAVMPYEKAKDYTR